MRLRGAAAVRGFARGLAALSVFSAGALAMTLPSAVGAQEADPLSEEVPALPEAYLDGYAWWNKAQQLPTGGQGVPAQPCTSTDVNPCPAGPPADGIYVVHDYESVGPSSAVTGPIGNLPSTPGLPPPPPQAPVPNPSQPKVIGPTAFGAVRFVLPEGAETELSLQILSKSTTTPAGQDPSVGQVFGCLVSTPGWASIQNGRYDQSPGYDCSSADEADVNGDQLLFQFPAGMVVNGTVDVAIVGAGETPFQMALAAPRDDSLRIVNAEELVEDAAFEDFQFEDPLTEFEESLADTGALTGDFAYTADESVLSVPAPVARPQPERAVTAGRVVNPFSPDATRGERIMAVLLLLALGLGLWWVGGQPARAPRLLGSIGRGRAVDVAAPASGGIGRFVRPRQGRPPRLF